MPKLQDFTHDDWLRWMQATPEGITLYADDAVIEHLEKILAPYSRVFGDKTAPASEIGYRTLSGNGVTIRRKSQVVREGIELGRQLERDALAEILRGRRP